MNHVAGLFHMHDEVAGATAALKSFQACHPDGEVHLLGNLPAPLSAVTEVLGIASSLSVPYIDRLRDLEAADMAWDLSQIEDCVASQLGNLDLGLSRLSSGYCVYMHPDHRMVRPLRTPRSLALEINYVNPIDSELISRVERGFQGRVTVPFWGIWGYMHRESVRETLDWLRTGDTLATFLEIDRRFVYDDLLLPVALQLRSRPVGREWVTRELRRPEFWPPWRRPVLLHHVYEEGGGPRY